LIDLVSSNCERSVSTTSMYSWNAFETENHAANRGLVDEISGKVVPKYDRTSMQRWKSGLEILTVPCLKEGDGLEMGQLAEVLIHTIEAWQEYDHYGLTEADRDELAAMMDMYFLNNPINIVSGKHDHYLNANLVDFLGHSPQLKSNFLKGFFNDDAGLPAQLSPDYLLEGGALTIMHYADALNRLHYQFANDTALQQDIRKRAQRLQSDLNLMQTTYSERLESVMFY